METQNKVRVLIPDEYRELFNPYWRNLVYHGGRCSLKSHSIARALLVRARSEKLRILCTREIQNTIADSVIRLLSDLISYYGFNDYTVQRDTITNNVTGSQFIFKGLKHNPTEIKSLEGVDVCWCEEAHSLSEESIDLLTPTIRKPGSQLIFSFNRMTELDPVYVKFVLKAPPKTYVKHVNYDVALKLGWMPDVLRQEMEHDKASDPDLYAHKWLGEPMSQTDRAILNRSEVLAAMSREVDDDGGEVIGVDIARFGSDATVFTLRKGHAFKNQKRFTKLSAIEICDELEKFARFRKNKIVDGKKVLGTPIMINESGVGGGPVDIMKSRDYNVFGINFGGSAGDKDKYPNWISEAWFNFAELLPYISLPMDSDLLTELTTRRWHMDSKQRRCVESKDDYKKRGYKSPDRADSVIEAFSPPPKSKLTILLD